MAEGSENQISQCGLYTIMLLMMLFGTLNTVVLKLMDETEVEGGVLVENSNGEFKPKVYNHPFFQGFNMFLGELMCLFVYFIKKQVTHKKTEEDQIPLSPGTKKANEV